MGAFAISLSTAYAIGHVMGLKHCMHRGGRQAKGFYGIYAALIVGAAAIVLIPGSPLGLHTLGVQVLAGCCPAPRCSCCYTTTRPSLGPWANRAKTSIFTATIVAILITLSVILAASVMFPPSAPLPDHRDHNRLRRRGHGNRRLPAAARAQAITAAGRPH